MFLKFVDFWETSGAELIETEVFLYSNKLNIAGTCDLVCKINDEIWVIDLKTSNNLQTTYDVQSAIYAQCFEECYEAKVDRIGILWLKSSKRGYKDGKLQGKGWEVYESKRSIKENLEIYSHVRALFDLEHPVLKPISEKVPTSVRKQYPNIEKLQRKNLILVQHLSTNIHETDVIKLTQIIDEIIQYKEKFK
jgi:hypothetical protein